MQITQIKDLGVITADLTASRDFYVAHLGFAPVFVSDWYIHLRNGSVDLGLMAAKPEMPAVPAGAIVYEGASARVWVANPETRSVVSRPVVVGDTSNGMVEIRKGLVAGETVVTSGTLFIDRAARRD